MEMDHATELEAQQRRAADEGAAMEDRHDVELTRMRREQEKAVAALKEESSAQLAAERQAMKRLWRPRSATTRTKSRPCAAALKTSWLPVKQSASAI